MGDSKIFNIKVIQWSVVSGKLNERYNLYLNFDIILLGMSRSISPYPVRVEASDFVLVDVYTS